FGIGARSLADHEVYTDRVRWMLDNRPEIASKIIVNQCADFPEIEIKSELAGLLHERLRQPFRKRAGCSSSKHHIYKGRSRCDPTRQRCEQINNPQSVIVSSQTFSAAGNA